MPPLPRGRTIPPDPPIPSPGSRGPARSGGLRALRPLAKSREERARAVALCWEPERRWQVLWRLGQTFLYTAFPTLLPKSLPNYTPCPCLSLVFKHPGLLRCQINSGEQLERLTLSEGKGRVFLLSPQHHTTALSGAT